MSLEVYLPLQFFSFTFPLDIGENVIGLGKEWRLEEIVNSEEVVKSMNLGSQVKCYGNQGIGGNEQER